MYVPMGAIKFAASRLAFITVSVPRKPISMMPVLVAGSYWIAVDMHLIVVDWFWLYLGFQ